MASSESHAVRNGVIATVLGGIALAILGALWPASKRAVAWFWAALSSFAGVFGATYATPGWVLALLGLLGFVTVVRFLVGLRSVAAGPLNNYVEDILYGAKWRWSWSGGEIVDLWCFCPRCDAELIYDDSRAHSFYSREEPKTLFLCAHCNGKIVASIDGGGKSYALGAVRREILRRIRMGQNAVNSDGG